MPGLTREEEKELLGTTVQLIHQKKEIERLLHQIAAGFFATVHVDFIEWSKALPVEVTFLLRFFAPDLMSAQLYPLSHRLADARKAFKRHGLSLKEVGSSDVRFRITLLNTPETVDKLQKVDKKIVRQTVTRKKVAAGIQKTLNIIRLLGHGAGTQHLQNALLKTIRIQRAEICRPKQTCRRHQKREIARTQIRARASLGVSLI